MKSKIISRVFVLGDNVDTDQIIPAEYLVYSLTKPDEAKLYGKYALSGVPFNESGLPNGNIKFIEENKFVSLHDIIIAGKNFGCGSSREHAPFALKMAGVQAIVAESFARIFYRNAVDGGFLIPIESKFKIKDKIDTGNLIEINLVSMRIDNICKSTSFELKDLGVVKPIIEAGGIFNYAKINKMI
ncbi:MAG: 3-isopropylmalate dehydratase [Ignavibacteriales bacterium]|nr:3-isopropylmalate dehydratase [Ignavibacteriales bacterium]